MMVGYCLLNLNHKPQLNPCPETRSANALPNWAEVPTHHQYTTHTGMLCHRPYACIAAARTVSSALHTTQSILTNSVCITTASPHTPVNTPQRMAMCHSSSKPQCGPIATMPQSDGQLHAVAWPQQLPGNHTGPGTPALIDKKPHAPAFAWQQGQSHRAAQSWSL